MMNSYDDTLGMPGQGEMNAERKPVKPSGKFMPGTVKQEAKSDSASANTGSMPPPSEMEEAFSMPDTASGILDNNIEEQATSAFNVLYGMEEVTATVSEPAAPEVRMEASSSMEATPDMGTGEETVADAIPGIKHSDGGIAISVEPDQQEPETHAGDVFAGMEEVKTGGDDLGMPVMTAPAPENNISEKTADVVEQPAAEEKKPEPQKASREIGPKRVEKEDGRKRLAAKRVTPKPERKEEEKPVESAKPQKAAQKDMGKEDYWLDIIEKNDELNYFQAEIIRLVATETDLPRAARLLERLIASKKQ